jgi:hypothetical protein
VALLAQQVVQLAARPVAARLVAPVARLVPARPVVPV